MVHNCSGSVLGALFQRIQLPTFAATVELLACRKAMLFAKELRAMDCIFKGDAEVIIQAIRNKDSTRPEYGHVINDILSLARDFQFCSFSHVKCISNSKLFGFIFFITLNFHYLSLITYHSSLNFSHPFDIITQFSSLNIFHTISGPIPVSQCNFFFFFSFFVFVFSTQTHQS